MSQRTEKIRRQVDQLRADVDALQAVWLAQEHHAAAELEASAKRARQAHRRAREAKAIAQTWRRNAILALILAGLTGFVALAISVKAAEEPTTPTEDEPAVFDTGRLPGDDTPAQEPEEPENELIEAAKIDGCNPFKTFLQICFPMAKPTIATLSIFCFMNVWNDYFTPLIYINDSRKYTLPLGLASMKGMYSTDWPVLMASSVISVLPVLIAFLFAQDAFVKGVMMTGMKE